MTGQLRALDARMAPTAPFNGNGYNFAYLDEQTKRMIRRAILKAVAIPGYQVPFGSREMPLPYGWGTGGIQVTAAVIGPRDVLKVIDQGSDDTTNAVNIRRFFRTTTGVATTTSTAAATIIQTRHRIPEVPLAEGQILVYQVPIPEPLRWLEPSESETRKMEIIKTELLDIKTRFGDARRTQIVYSADDISMEDLIEDEQMVITISHEGYIKRTKIDEFRTQARGGVGSRGAKTKEEDFTEHLFVANTHSYLFIFTDKGRLFWVKVYEIPEGSKTSKGRAVQNLSLIHI